MIRVAFALSVLGGLFISAGEVRAAPSPHEFAPAVAVSITDDTLLSHPDIAVDITIPAGSVLAQTRVLTPAGGGVARSEDVPDGWTVGYISGYTTIPAADGTCSQRFAFEADVWKTSAAGDGHVIAFASDVAETPVRIVVDEVEIGGQRRLQTTATIGDPGVPIPNCAPFRSRFILLGSVAEPPVFITTAPPAAGARDYEITLISRPDAAGEVHTVTRTVTATVAPGLDLRIDGNEARWNTVEGAVDYRLGGTLTFTTSCEQIRRLVIREEWRQVNERGGAGANRAPLPLPPSAEHEAAQIILRASAYDAEGVLLARDDFSWTRPFEECWYPPGTEPILSVEPGEGPCDGPLTFRGERFPQDVTVEITMPVGIGDAAGVTVATAPVWTEGTFSVSATLPEGACDAAVLLRGRLNFLAYNADEPKTLTVFASASYDAEIPPGYVLRPPQAGAGVVGYRTTLVLWIFPVVSGLALVCVASLASRRAR